MVCELCGSEEERAKGRKANSSFADRVRVIEHIYRDLAKGVLMPHSEDCKRRFESAKYTVKRLVEEIL